jgi:hypothetical protein
MAKAEALAYLEAKAEALRFGGGKWANGFG